MEVKRGLFERLHNVSLLLKIFFLLSVIALIVSLWFFLLCGALLIADVVLSVYRSKLLFTYSYRFSGDVFRIVKIDLDGKETIEESIDVKDVVSVEFAEKTNEKAYYSDADDFGEDKPLRIRTEKDCFFILSDLYLYSILCYASGVTK